MLSDVNNLSTMRCEQLTYIYIERLITYDVRTPLRIWAMFELREHAYITYLKSV